MATTLNVIENKSLRKLERTIADGLKSFVEVGQALAEIRDSRLYRESHKSFEAYCLDRWQFKRQRAYELIEASGVAERVSEISDTLPKESHAAELAALPEAEQAETWQEVLAETDDKPTAAKVREVVERKQPKVAEVERDREAAKSFHQRGGDDDEEFEPAEAEPVNLNSDLDAVKAGYLALSFAKQVAMCDFIQDNPPKGK